MWNGNLRQDDTLWVVCLATGVDAADKALLPAVFKALGGEMGVATEYDITIWFITQK